MKRGCLLSSLSFFFPFFFLFLSSSARYPDRLTKWAPCDRAVAGKIKTTHGTDANLAPGYYGRLFLPLPK